MTQVSGTFDSYDSINFEDLSNVLYNISPTQTPFMSRIARTKARAVFHEWVIENLAAADGTNAVIEADEASFDTGNTGTRVGNRVQISDKAVIVSDTNEWIESPGDNSKLAHQLAIKTKELKRDMETILTSNQASVTGNSSTARKLGGYESWITTNDSRGAGGSDGGFSSGNTAAATDGTQRAFTEALLKVVVKAAYDAGGEPDTLSVGSFNKQVASGFAGIASQTKSNTGNGQATILAGADVYISDFSGASGIQIVPNRFQRSRSALLYDASMWAVAYGAPVHMDELAKTGHAEKRMLTVEYTLEARNEASSGVVADLTTS